MRKGFICMSSNNLVLNRFFTQYVFSDLTVNHSNKIYNTIIEQYLKNDEPKKNSQIIAQIYKYMSKYYRNEYFYQNTLLNNLLLGRHSLNTTTALTQIPIGKSKADFILINGKAVVYEIKTELDTFDRLDTQIEDYYKAFDYVCVVTCESNYVKLEKMLKDQPVGICILTKDKRLQFRKEPEQYQDKISHEALFKILHKNEFENLIYSFYKKLPVTTPVRYYDECFRFFEQIPLNTAYPMVLKQLKNRNQTIREYYGQVPYELKSLLYFFNAKEKDYLALLSFLQGEYRG